jgi:hypothetical protein
MKSGEIYLYKHDNHTRLKLLDYVGDGWWDVKFLNNAVYLDFPSGEMTDFTSMRGEHIFENYIKVGEI